MNFLILGAGKMSEGVVYDIINTCRDSKIYICDLKEDNLETIEAHFKSKNIHTIIFDATDYRSYERLLDGIDIVISTLPYRYNYKLSKITVESSIHWIDLGGNLDVVNRQMELNKLAENNGVCLIPDTGLAPGLVSIVSAYLLLRIKNAADIRIMVGGLPLIKDNPLNYRIVFSVNGLINEYLEDCIVLENNKVAVKKALDDLELITFPEPFGELEAFNTSGGSSTMPHTMSRFTENLSYKTIRYKGHKDLIKSMLDLGFADNTINSFNGISKTSRELFEILLGSSLKTTMNDAVLARILITSKERRIEADLIRYNEKEKNLSAMMICTGFPASIIAQMCLGDSIKKRGFIYQELDIDPEIFFNELKKRNINFLIKEEAE